MIGEKGETPAFVYRDLGDFFPLISRRERIGAECAQFIIANDAFAADLDVVLHFFDLRS
jgi:hypothetical protein